ncbi:MAG: hypothetical protein HYW80_01180 [Parcubacteria group bacterium]|nr:hypothetical protein [Parcubacteria group bacterium]
MIVPRKQFREKFNALPPSLKAAIVSEETANILWEIVAETGFPEGKIPELAQIVGGVLAGFTPLSRFEQELIEKLNLSSFWVGKVSNPIRERIFKPVAADLVTVQPFEEESAKKITVTGPPVSAEHIPSPVPPPESINIPAQPQTQPTKPITAPEKPSVISPPASAKPFTPPPRITFPQTPYKSAGETPRPATPIPPLREVRFSPQARVEKPGVPTVITPLGARPLPTEAKPPSVQPQPKPQSPPLKSPLSASLPPIKSQPVSIKPIVEQKPSSETSPPPTAPVAPPPVLKPLPKPRNNHEVIDLSKFDFPPEKPA